MKKNFFKRIIVACVAAMTMVAGTVTASAADYYYIKINSADSKQHDYVAYQIFAGDVKDENGAKNLTNIEWGNGVDVDNLKTALISDTTLTQFSSLTATSTASDFAKAMGNVTGSANLKKLASIIKNNVLESGKKSEFKVTQGSEDDVIPIKENDCGYYIVFEENTTANTESAQTAYILQVVGGSVTVEAKTSVPTFDKSIIENGEKVNVSDHNVGDIITFELEATIGDISDYETYKLWFMDTLSDGLTFNGVDTLTVKAGTTTLTTSQYAVDVTGQSLKITINDAKALGLAKGDKLTATYTATLNNDAVIGSTGNPNECYLEFSNNPNNDEEKGKTPDDKVTVYAYQIIVEKVDSANTATKLAGAEFKLKNSDGKFAVIENDMFKEWSDDGSVLTTDANGLVTFKGIDAGSYELVEVKAPEGYNKLNSAITVEVKPTYTNDTLTALGDTTSIEYAVADGSAKAQVGNSKGLSLPTTGGIGTTIFFVSGGVIVAGAAVALIIKKRIKNVD